MAEVIFPLASLPRHLEPDDPSSSESETLLLANPQPPFHRSIIPGMHERCLCRTHSTLLPHPFLFLHGNSDVSRTRRHGRRSSQPSVPRSKMQSTRQHRLSSSPQSASAPSLHARLTFWNIVLPLRLRCTRPPHHFVTRPLPPLQSQPHTHTHTHTRTHTHTHCPISINL